MPSATQSADQPFAVSGRLSVNLDGKGHVANFDWRHQPERDQLAINSPLGNTVAEVVRDAGGVTLLADGKAWQAPDVESLTEKTLGWPLPLSGLAWWIRGMPVPGEASEIRPDGELLQQGWRIRFVREAESGERYPKRVDLARDGLTVRVVTRDWR
ncbi:MULTISPECIES: lipoprotein insertase outer membrane protein LolB [Chromobacterium]|nr:MULTISPECIES: lipoprotein insertase outer membrane protein LolB [Chromobacterium]